jgi:hypothetical protein
MTVRMVHVTGWVCNEDGSNLRWVDDLFTTGQLASMYIVE